MPVFLSALETDEIDLLGGIDFFVPFTPSTSADIADPVRTNTLPISIGGRSYVLDLSQYKRQSLNPFRNAQDPSREPGEQTLSVEGVWKRTQFNWTHGAGLEFADDDSSDRERYWQSRHVDIWTRRKVSLLRDTEIKLAGTSTLLFVAGLYVYAWNGGQLKAALISNAGHMAAPTWVDQTLTGTPLHIATDGDHVFVATSGGIRKLTVGTPGDTLLNATAFDHIWFANGWLLCAIGEKLYTVSSTGTLSTVIYTHHNASWRWASGTAAPNAIYLLGTNSIGTRTEVYRLTVKDDGSALNVPIFSGDLPNGEVGKTILYYQNRIMIGTDKGFRLAAIGNSGELSIGPLVTDPGVVSEFAAYGRYVYAAGTLGLWRMDLSNETESLVPPYAADLEAPAGTATSATKVIATPVGMMFIDSKVHGPTTKYCPSGTLTSGWFGMGSPERKVLSSGSIRSEPLPGDGINNTSIALSAQDDANVPVVLGTLDLPGGRDPGVEWGGQGLDSEVLRTIVTLYSSATDQVATPVLRRMTMRMIPAPVMVEEILCTILMADKVGAEAGKARAHYDPYEEYRFLKTLEESRQVVNYREGQITYRVTVRGVSLEKPEKWSDRFRFFNGTITVRLITEEGIPPTTGS